MTLTMSNVVHQTIEDVTLCPLQTHSDDRGSLTEIFRAAWTGAPPFVQWNFVRSRAGVLRGFHGHIVHADYLILLEGSASIGLKDLRPLSPTENRAGLVNLDGRELKGLTIPPGVAHGFYFHANSLMVYGVTDYWTAEDELGCRWDDPELGIDWPESSADISERDALLPPLSVFRSQIQAGLQRAKPARNRSSEMASTT
jgi:dTDP-4-dehydrorhamnose 3,5-epimerase